ncbi:MAG: hypothetical protein DMG12_23365 [Acidobacteria bacterium]|nr:MAG: hypothetical protein DMG12_23365 [Acidobacteriota bacterium]
MRSRLVLLLISFVLAGFAWRLPPSSFLALGAPSGPVLPRQIGIVPGSSTRGAELFREKTCIECHAFNGSGGTLAPDLAQGSEHARTPMLETADLFAYFFSLSYFSTPGDAAHGRMIFERASCSRCHATEAAGRDRRRPAGPPISTWSEVDDPLAWAERMWNHSELVYSDLSSNGLPRPELSTKDMVDLLVYLRTVPESRSHSAVFQPGNPEKGRVTFESSCESCHSFGSRTAEHKIDLLKTRGPVVLTDYVTAMWNHAPLMHRRAGNNFPILGPGDMGNLIAYLFAQRYFDEEGNAARGAQVFDEKNCKSCHEQRRLETRAPDLTIATERYSPITLSASVWRHGPAMLEAIKEKELAWPEFSGSEMSDLIAYLNSRLVPRIANPKE